MAGADLADGGKYLRGRHAHCGMRPPVNPCPLMDLWFASVVARCTAQAHAATCEKPPLLWTLLLKCQGALRAWGAMRSMLKPASRALRPVLAKIRSGGPSGLTTGHAQLLPAHQRHSPASSALRSQAPPPQRAGAAASPGSLRLRALRLRHVPLQRAVDLVQDQLLVLHRLPPRGRPPQACAAPAGPRAPAPPLRAGAGAPDASGGAPR
jgi:hypothetical protein